jgi:hypothetical protein
MHHGKTCSRSDGTGRAQRCFTCERQGAGAGRPAWRGAGFALSAGTINMRGPLPNGLRSVGPKVFVESFQLLPGLEVRRKIPTLHLP